MSEEAAVASPAPDASAPAEQNAQPTAEELLEYTANGQKVKLPKAEVLRRAALADGAWSKFEEAHKLRQEVEQKFQSAIKSKDPQKVASLLKEYGYDPREFGESYLRPLYEREMADPETRAKMEFEEEKRRFEEEKRAIEEEKRTKQEQAEFEQARARFQAVFDEAMKGAPDLPKTPYTVQRLAHWTRAVLQSGIENVTMDDIVNQVREEYRNESKQSFGSLDGDALLEILGEDVVKKIEQARLARLNRRPASQQPATKQVQSSSQKDDIRKPSSGGQYQPW